MSIRRLYSPKVAEKIAERAHRKGKVPKDIARYIAFACRENKLRYALGYAMFEQESDFKNVYGHDANGLYAGEKVSRDNYRKFRELVVATQGRGANGVGLGQVTYWTYIRDHRRLWKPRVQVYLATSILADLVHRLGETDGVGAYNGGEASPNTTYALEVLARAKSWRKLLKGNTRE